MVDGKYTGEIDYYAYADEKAHAIEAMAAERGYDLEDCFAYSDSITDAPMLEVVGHPHAVNPDRELRKLAASKGWPVLQFTRPVTLRSRIPVKPTLAAALTIGTAVTLGRRDLVQPPSPAGRLSQRHTSALPLLSTAVQTRDVRGRS